MRDYKCSKIRIEGQNPQFLFLYPYPRIHCHHIVAIGEEGVDVEFLYLGGKAEESGETDDYLGVFLLVDTLLPARTFYYLICTQGMNHRRGLGIGQGGKTARHIL